MDIARQLLIYVPITVPQYEQSTSAREEQTSHREQHHETESRLTPRDESEQKGTVAQDGAYCQVSPNAQQIMQQQEGAEPILADAPRRRSRRQLLGQSFSMIVPQEPTGETSVDTSQAVELKSGDT